VWSTLLDKKTKTAGIKAKHNIFDHKASSTFKMIPKATWRIKYGDGSTASGIVGTDRVDLGGLVIREQAVQLSKILSPQFSSGVGDGLLGLGYGSINTVRPHKVCTAVESVRHQELWQP
jgi:hypothetical protein